MEISGHTTGEITVVHPGQEYADTHLRMTMEEILGGPAPRVSGNGWTGKILRPLLTLEVVGGKSEVAPREIRLTAAWWGPEVYASLVLESVALASGAAFRKGPGRGNALTTVSGLTGGGPVPALLADTGRWILQEVLAA